MAWLVVDKDEHEFCYNNKPIFLEREGYWISTLLGSDSKFGTSLPKGTINKIIGKTLTFEQSPYNI